jgi:hypothetical protein
VWSVFRTCTKYQCSCSFALLVGTVFLVCSHRSLPPALLFRSTPANPAMLTSTSTTASAALPAPLDSWGPCTVHMMDVFPMERYDDPELAGFVEICAWSRRSSFHRRPSSRSLVRGYVVEVSSGIVDCKGRGGKTKKRRCEPATGVLADQFLKGEDCGNFPKIVCDSGDSLRGHSQCLVIRM